MAPATLRAGPAPGMPSGLSAIGWLTSRPGENAVASTRNAIAIAEMAAAGHQRRDGSRPSGYSSRPNVTAGENPNVHTQPETQPTAKAPGTAPGAVTNPYQAYGKAKSAVAIAVALPT